MSNHDDDALLNEFLAESHEHLAGIEADLLTLEEQGANADDNLINKVFRAAHSLKGGSAFFGLVKIQELAHKTETALAMVRSREIIPNPEVANILLLAFDKLRELINDPAGSNDADISEQVVALTGLSSSYLPPGKKESLTSHTEVTFGGGRIAMKLPSFDLSHQRDSGKFLSLLRLDLIHDVERVGRTPLTVMQDLMALAEIVDVSVHLEAVGSLEDEPANVIPFDIVLSSLFDAASQDSLAEMLGLPADHFFAMDEAPPTVPATAVPVAPSIPTARPAPALDLVPTAEVTPMAESRADTRREPAAEPAASAIASVPAEATLRVNISVLETLMNLAGELVLSRNQLRDALARRDELALAASSQRISLVTSELQEAIMQTRLQPVGNLFGKFPRVVRDLSRTLGKEVQLELDGREVEMDKNLIEGLSDPLTHMVRNAIDHGIETPAERTRLGKRVPGLLRLRASHEAGQVVIDISDDGKGIDPARVAASAIKKGLITQEKVQSLSDQEKMAMIFLPGLSTAEKVTDVSGRGVGMDVVKTNLDRLGGKVEIESQLGHGSLFRIRMPLTLAIIPSLIVAAGDERFAIPQSNVIELIRVPADSHQERFARVGEAEVLMLRGELIPVLRLASLILNQRPAISADAGPPGLPAPAAPSDASVVLVSDNGMRYGLIVDQLHNTEEIVVKPLGRHLKHLREYAGATIMGDGKVILILDTAGLAAKAGLAAGMGSGGQIPAAGGALEAPPSDVHSLLTFQNAPGETCAVPLELVLRVERVAASQVEMIGGRRTMQYRGVSLPLVTLADTAKVESLQAGQDWAVIVFQAGEREVGLLGALPVDVVETQAPIDGSTLRQKGVAGSALICGQTVLLVDLNDLVDAFFPDAAAFRLERTAGSGRPHTILLAEDSDFFRAQVKQFLLADGYEVLEAPDGEAAWELLQGNAEKVEAVVTDIEMPRLTGLGLTQRLRADQRFARVPVIGLTSLAGAEDVARGKAAGINDYQVKLDRDKLTAALRDFFDGKT